MLGLKQVLIADDDSAITQALTLLLQSAGYRVTSASAPRQLLRLVNDADFGLLILDLNYSRGTTTGAEGLSLLREIRQVKPGLPIFVMTAWSSPDVERQARQSGASEYLHKPWDDEELIRMVRRIDPPRS